MPNNFTITINITIIMRVTIDSINSAGIKSPSTRATMKTKVVCRFCGQSHAKRMEGDGYKPVLYPHKCPHGKKCFGGMRNGKGQNWSVLVLGGKDVDGCRECYNWQLTVIKTKP